MPKRSVLISMLRAKLPSLVRSAAAAAQSQYISIRSMMSMPATPSG
ncbi:MAG: hypothetical protein HC850_08770 [Rhodomicrobium sp.]|nr:hypothetical protein [Rhodomicrobium sp.]